MIRDYLGNEFNSVKDMCKYHGVHRDTYRNRIKAGMSQKEALTPVETGVVDHLGNHFSTKKEMLDHYGISGFCFKNRQSKGYSLEECLTGIKNHNSPKFVDISLRTDHLGNVYESQKGMCRHYGISTDIFKRRRASGLSIEESLISRPVYDHLGHGFPSLVKMCEHYDTKFTTYKARKNKGWSLEECLLGKKNTKEVVPVEDRTDFNGKVFNSQKEMCDYYGISNVTYGGRIKRGWSKKEALTVNSHVRGTEVVYRGERYSSIRKLCESNSLDYPKIISRIQNGWSIEEALEIKYSGVHIRAELSGDVKILKSVYKRDGMEYFVCLYNGKEEVLSSDDIVMCNSVIREDRKEKIG